MWVLCTSVKAVACVCVCVCMCVCVCVCRIQKNDSAGSVLEAWGLWLRSASAGALLYKAMAYRRLHVSAGVSVRSGFYISCPAVCSLVNEHSNAETACLTTLKLIFRVRMFLPARGNIFLWCSNVSGVFSAGFLFWTVWCWILISVIHCCNDLIHLH